MVINTFEENTIGKLYELRMYDAFDGVGMETEEKKKGFTPWHGRDANVRVCVRRFDDNNNGSAAEQVITRADSRNRCIRRLMQIMY